MISGRALRAALRGKIMRSVWARLLAATTVVLVTPHILSAMTRNESLINSFQVLCTLEKPSFARIEAKASAMKLPVIQDIRNATGRSKSWNVTLTSGPHQLVATDATGPNGHVVICGISAPDADGASFRTDLIRVMKLGAADNDGVLPNGAMRTMVWKNEYGPGTALQFLDAEPAGKPGAMLDDISIEPLQK